MYGCLFTCFTSCAIHIEDVSSLETDAFIQVLRRFIWNRGCPKEIWSDNGTNFVGADKGIQPSIREWNEDKLSLMNAWSKTRSVSICAQEPSGNFNHPQPVTWMEFGRGSFEVSVSQWEQSWETKHAGRIRNSTHCVRWSCNYPEQSPSYPKQQQYEWLRTSHSKSFLASAEKPCSTTWAVCEWRPLPKEAMETSSISSWLLLEKVDARVHPSATTMSQMGAREEYSVCERYHITKWSRK